MSKRAPKVPPPLIYVDTSVYFDLLAKETRPHPKTQRPRWESAKALFDAVNDNRVVLAASALIEAEVNCLAVVRDGHNSVHEMVRGWFTAPSTKWTDVDRFLARDAVKLAQQWHQHAAPDKKLGGADATHLAAAVRLGCGYLMTQDTGSPLGQTVENVQVMLPDDVWPTTLFDVGIIEEQSTKKPLKAAPVAGKPSKRGNGRPPTASLPPGNASGAQAR